MIIGIGTDLCQVSRMGALLTDSSFLMRYFDAQEQDYVLGRGMFAAESMAGHFAAKEAFVKALGRGFDGVKPEDIGIRHRENGAPFYELRGTAAAAFERAGIRNAHLSIAHDGGLAAAFCVLEA